MSKRNHLKNTGKLKNALAHGYMEGFGPMCNSRHPRKVKLPLPQKEAAPGAANTQDGEQTQHSS